MFGKCPVCFASAYRWLKLGLLFPVGKPRQHAISLALLVLFESFVPGSAHEPERTLPLTTQIEALPEENFAYGLFQCWPLLSGTHPRCVLCVVLHPHNTHAAIFAEPKPWIEFARAHGCALVGLSFANSGVADSSWGKARLGSGRALLAALTEFGRRGVPGIDSVPIVIAGVCEGGQYAYEFAGEHPERTAAFITIGGSQHELALVKEAAAIPALLIATPDRGEGTTDNMISLFVKGRTLAAPWGLASEPMALYDNISDRGLASDFLNMVLSHLSSDESVVSKMTLADGTLFPLRIGSNTSAIFDHLGVAPQKAVDMLGGIAAWYPDPSFAKACMCDATYNPTFPALPFPSREIKSICQISPTRVDLPAMQFNVPSTKRQFSFEISLPDMDASVDVHVLDVPRVQGVRVTKIAAGHWRAEGEVDLNGMTAGSFKLELPVRVYGPTGIIPGGVSVPMRGFVNGDVVANTRAINFGTVKAGSVAKAELKLTSLSGANVELQSFLSSTAQRLSAVNVAAGGDWISLRLEIPTERIALPGDAFSGYILLKVRSNGEQTIKLLYYGFVANRAEGIP